jgi:hypothetical protein
MDSTSPRAAGRTFKLSRRTKWSAAGGGAVFVVVLAAYFVTREAPGHATPEQAARAFLAAIESGDRAAIRREIDPECRARRAYADAVAERLSYVKPMADALVRHAGWTRGEWIETPIPEMVNISQMTARPVTVRGDFASAGGCVMRRAGGLWKVTTRRSLEEPVEPTDKRNPSPHYNNALRAALPHLAAGRFKSAEEFHNHIVDIVQTQMHAELTSVR